jgi:DNA-binding NarL/FixJ family response regulator
MTPIRLLLADDHRLFRQGMRQICEVLGGFSVVGEAENGEEAVRLVLELQPDVILMDINMPLLDGVQATAMITEKYPAARVIILTMYRQDRYVFEAIKAGARGYLLKRVGHGPTRDPLFRNLTGSRCRP